MRMSVQGATLHDVTDSTSIFCQNVSGQHYFRVADNLGTISPCDLGWNVLLGPLVRLAPHPLAGGNNAISVRFVCHMAL
jgi:hypothetical protein